ncbi:TolC family protein [Alienimonas californiensis]|uniref:TolC family protein n=1 Tax=Alienimonas californiensis TaxID=2527989 RepID=UPI00119F1C53|nr:TolC family protein [Alienimonas californiensis]
MNRPRTPLTAPGYPRKALRRMGSAAIGAVALAGCGTAPTVVTYSPGSVVAPPAIAGAGVAAAEASVTEPIQRVAAAAAEREPAPVHPANYQADAQEPAAAPLPAPLPAGLDETDVAADEAHAFESLTLAEAEGTALAQNPTLAGATAAVRKARGLYTQVGLRPNPTVGLMGEDIGEGGEAGQYGVFASQTFVRGNKLELSRAVESWEVRGLELRAEAQRLRTLTDVRQRFVRLLAAQRRVEIADELVTLAEAGVQLSEDLLEAGEVARPDVLQTRIQLGEVRIAQQNALVARDAAWRDLMAAVGTPGRPVRPAAGTLEGEPLAADFEELLAGILAASPEVAAARVRIERAKAAVCRQQVQPIPNLNAQASLAYGVEGEEPIGGFQLGMPLPVHNDNRGNIAAAIADVHRAAADLARLELNLRSRLAAALSDYEAAQNRATLLADDVLPAARENLDLSEQGYRQGEFDAIRLVTARRSLFEAELAQVTAAADRQEAAALIDGLLLSGALDDLPDAGGANLQGVGLRDEALGGE